MRAPEISTASARSAAVSPPDSIHGRCHRRPAMSRQSKARPLPPGSASLRRGGLASNSRRSAISSYEAAAATSSSEATEIAFMTRRPKRDLTSAMRAGVSLPWNCRMSIGAAARMERIVSSSASTRSATRATWPGTVAARAAARTGAIARGLGG